LRWAQQTTCADQVARFLMQHDQVSDVHHAWGAASLVTFSVGDAQRAQRLLKHLWRYTTNSVDQHQLSRISIVGGDGFRSSAPRTSASGALATKQTSDSGAGRSANLLRCEVGTTDAEEFMNDLARALADNSAIDGGHARRVGGSVAPLSRSSAIRPGGRPRS
jgi:cystathionine beta-lyase/cystathionine gamma-synthase